MTEIPNRLKPIELFAWLGEDELGSGEIGIKQGLVPAGYIPLVAIKLDKISGMMISLNAQAAMYGKKVYLCRFTLQDVVGETVEGEPL